MVCWFPTRQPITPRTTGDGPHMAASSAPCNRETEDATPAPRKRQGRAAYTYQSESKGPPSTVTRSRRAGTIRPRDGARNRTLRQRPLNGEALSNLLTLPLPQRPTDQPVEAVERGNHDSQTSPKKDDAGIDDEPFHHEASAWGPHGQSGRTGPEAGHDSGDPFLI